MQNAHTVGQHTEEKQVGKPADGHDADARPELHLGRTRRMLGYIVSNVADSGFDGPGDHLTVLQIVGGNDADI